MMILINVWACISTVTCFAFKMLIRNSRSPVGYVYSGIVLDHLKKCHLTYTDDKLVW